MPSFEMPADIFTRLSVFDSPKGSSNTFKALKNISRYFKTRHLIIYNYCLLSVSAPAIRKKILSDPGSFDQSFSRNLVFVISE